jgi:hypothetical protein
LRLLSRPFPHRSTPITTTGPLPFTVRSTQRARQRHGSSCRRREVREEAESRIGVAAALEQVLEGVPAFCYRPLPGRGSGNASLIT